MTAAIRRLSTSDTDSIRRELPTHHKYLMALARGVVHNESDALDLVQDTYRRALEHEEQFVTDTNLRGWLTVILRNAHRDRLRRAAFEVLMPAMEDLMARGVALPAPELADVPVWRMIEDRDLNRALQRLPPLYRDVYALRQKGWPYEEIGRHLGVSANTVATRLHRGRLWLRTALIDRLRANQAARKERVTTGPANG